jgi:flagellar motor switch protein FliN
MDENLDKSSLLSGIGGVPNAEFNKISEDNLETASLERALNLSQANSAERRVQSQRGEAMMPQGSLLQIPVNVQVILGTTRMSLSKVMSLGPGSVVALDKELSEPVVLLVNGNEVARGVIVVVNEKTGQLGISLTEISSGNSDKNFSKPA